MSDKRYLVHAYSSDYYDADYAHWYYENYTKKGLTKGRRKSPKLNEYGKAAAKTVKENINAQRDRELENVRAEKKGVMADLSDERSEVIKQEREKLKKDIKAHKDIAKNRIQQLWTELRTMTSSERASQTASIRSQIEDLKAANEKQKESLKNAYKDTVTDIREDYKQEGSQIREYYKGVSKQIVEKYNNLYLDELDKMAGDSEFTGRYSTGGGGSSGSRASSVERAPETPTKEKPKKLGSVASKKYERDNKTHGAGYKMYKLG